MCCHASLISRILASPRKSVNPATAATNAVMTAAPRSHIDARAQFAFPVDQKTRSVTKAETRNATGNGISMGWIGCPAMLAVLLGLPLGMAKLREDRGQGPGLEHP